MSVQQFSERRVASPVALGMTRRFLVLAILCAGALVVPYTLRFALDDPNLFWSAFQDSTVRRPFTYRVLLPFLSAVITRIIPVHPLLVHAVVMYVALLGFMLALRRLALVFWSPSPILDMLLLLSLPLVVFLSFDHQYIYDFPVLALSTLGLLLLARQQWNRFLLVLAVATLNKETSIFLILMFVAWYGPSWREHWFRQILVAQCLVYGSIRAVLIYTFRQRAGGEVEWHVSDHIGAYTSDPARAMMALSVCLFIVGLVAYQYRRKPSPLRRIVVGVVPIMIGLYSVFGYPYEVRIFYDLFAPVALLCLPPQLVTMYGAQSPADRDPE